MLQASMVGAASCGAAGKAAAQYLLSLCGSVGAGLAVRAASQQALPVQGDCCMPVQCNQTITSRGLTFIQNWPTDLQAPPASFTLSNSSREGSTCSSIPEQESSGRVAVHGSCLVACLAICRAIPADQPSQLSCSCDADQGFKSAAKQSPS